MIIVHSQSMFAGKTSVLSFIAEKVGREHVLVFQPQAAIRYGDEHLNNMIDRDKRKIPAITVTSNRLENVLEWIKAERTTPRAKPFVFLDELMLFWGSDDREAIGVLEELRRRGFSVVADGIDYTFQEKSFTFMLDLIAEAGRNPGWHQIEMGTRCKYCDGSARGSRRLKPDGSIAHFDDSAYEAGENYEPVCGDKHPSCVGQPKGFTRLPLPTEAVVK